MYLENPEESGPNMGRNRNSILLRAILAAAALIILLVGGYIVGRRLETSGHPEERSVMTEGFGQYEEWIVDGRTYYKRTGITNLLIIGVDRDTTQELGSYRNGGQADFLLLLSIDHQNNEIRQLQIDRDTIAEVPVLSIFGRPSGSKRMQICLSHAYGADQEACGANTVEAVEKYLTKVDVDFFLALDYSAIDVLNDLLGGVTVTLSEDFSHLDPEMKQGTTLTLHGHQAELFVRSRMSVGDGTNTSRQMRQRMWMNGAMDLLKQKLKSNAAFGDQLLDALGDGLITDAARGRILNEMNRAWQYTVRQVEDIPGVHTKGDDGFVEYHTEPDDVVNWVLSAFYRPAEQ